MEEQKEYDDLLSTLLKIDNALVVYDKTLPRAVKVEDLDLSNNVTIKEIKATIDKIKNYLKENA